ncbi:MAG: DUF192 domain-containing protein [Halorhabdus sp.]
MVLASPTGPLAPWLHPLDYGEATVTIQDENGTSLATVDVRIADTERERYVGLSETETLEDGEGMLFVHENTGTHAYVMPDDDDRTMSFPLDIVFIDADGRITTIHHAHLAENARNPDRRYRGQGRYVLEVPYGWTNETGIAVGDRVSIPDSVRD